MKKPTSSLAREELRLEHMANAGTEVVRLLEQAEIRNIDGGMVAVILSQVLAARNATLAGKVLMAVEVAIQKYPIVKIIGAGTVSVEGPIERPWEALERMGDDVVVDLERKPDGFYGPAN